MAVVETILDKFLEAIPSTLVTDFKTYVDYVPEDDARSNAMLVYISDVNESVKYFAQPATLNYVIITVEVRSDSFDDGFTVCEGIRNYFEKFHNDDFLGVNSTGSTDIMGKDEHDMRYFMATFRIIVKE